MRAAALLPLLLGFSACTQDAPEPAPVETEVPDELAQAAPRAYLAGDSIGTPMAERVATLGVLNKRNNISQDLVLKPGESRRLGNIVVRLAACEKSTPWEETPEEGAFVQVLVRERVSAGELEWRRVFSGWLFKNKPSVNVVEHPIYDVWVKSCAMRFPGEDAPVPVPSSSAATPSGSVPAPPSAAVPAVATPD